MDANIKGFFDNISHDWLLANIPIDKAILREWLKAGAVDVVKQEELESTDGVPQGGPISPTLANMALDGLQQHVSKSVEHLRKRHWSPKVNVIRYRDDFVVTAATKNILENYAKPAVKAFLAVRGLELNEEKTKIASMKEGFDFLGYNFRIYPYAKRSTGYIGLTKPSKKGMQRIIAKIRTARTETSDAGTLIMRLNPILRGWANYYSCASAKRSFGSIGYYMWLKLWKWATKQKRTVRRLRKRFVKSTGKRLAVATGSSTEHIREKISCFMTLGIPPSVDML
jgi:RNA-directed DNA polymerase